MGSEALLPGEMAAFRAVDAPECEALARDVWIESGRYLAELAQASVRNLEVAEPGEDGPTLLLTSPPRPGRRSSIPKMTWFFPSPDLARRLDASVRTRGAGPDDPLFVNQAGARYSPETLDEAMVRLAERAGLHRLPARHPKPDPWRRAPAQSEPPAPDASRPGLHLPWMEERCAITITAVCATADLPKFLPALTDLLARHAKRINVQVQKTEGPG